MKQKRVCFTELAYVFGILALAFGTAMMERADFGMSTVVAPAYLLHLKISQRFPAYSFGMSEYVLQAFLLVVLSFVVRKFKKGFLFSFVTAVVYGFALDASIRLVGLLPFSGIAWKIFCYLAGMVVCALGVSFLFHTYISPEAYELFVKEVSETYHLEIGKVKLAYDCCSCLVSVLLSFLFFGFGRFEGVKLGTIICSFINGRLIGFLGGVLESRYRFQDALKLRPVFSK